MKIAVRPLNESELNELAGKTLVLPDHPHRADTELSLYKFVNTEYEALGFISTLWATLVECRSDLNSSALVVQKPEYVISSANHPIFNNIKFTEEYASGIKIAQGCVSALRCLPPKILVDAMHDLTVQGVELYFGLNVANSSVIELGGVH